MVWFKHVYEEDNYQTRITKNYDLRRMITIRQFKMNDTAKKISNKRYKIFTRVINNYYDYYK